MAPAHIDATWLAYGAPGLLALVLVGIGIITLRLVPPLVSAALTLTGAVNGLRELAERTGRDLVTLDAARTASEAAWRATHAAHELVNLEVRADVRIALDLLRSNADHLRGLTDESRRGGPK